jgi:hypothetical protein
MLILPVVIVTFMHTILLLSQEDDFLSQGYHPAEESTVDPELLLEVGPGPG